MALPARRPRRAPTGPAGARRAAAALLALALAGCGKDDGPLAEASPSPSATEESASPGPSTSPSDSASPSPSASPSEGASASAALSPEAEQAVSDYRDYVAGQVDDIIAATEELVAALKSGNPPKARDRYPHSRAGWEGIEPVTAGLGDFALRVDARETQADSAETWTGWHRIEKAIFIDKSSKGMSEIGDKLLKDLEELRQKVPSLEITPASMVLGAQELVDDVVDDKLTGEEEAFSPGDLFGVKGALDGAKKVFELLTPAAERNDAALVDTLEEGFADAEEALAAYEEDGGYVPYDKVTGAQRAELAEVVDALTEPLSKFAAAAT